MPPARRSGLQTEVISLFRSYLRMTRSKPARTRPHFLLMVRYTFHTNAQAVAPRDINTVEHLLRRGRRQLEMYSDSGVKDCAVSEDMRRWERARSQRTPVGEN